MGPPQWASVEEIHETCTVRFGKVQRTWLAVVVLVAEQPSDVLASLLHTG